MFYGTSDGGRVISSNIYVVFNHYVYGAGDGTGDGGRVTSSNKYVSI